MDDAADASAAELAQVLDRETICDRIRQWTLAAERQHARTRVAEDAESDWAEMGLFVLAAHQVRRACQMGEVHAEIAIGSALATFDAAAPQLNEVRNVLTHFDDYDRGKGRLQTKGPVPRDLATWYQNDDWTTVLHVGPYASTRPRPGTHAKPWPVTAYGFWILVPQRPRRVPGGRG